MRKDDHTRRTLPLRHGRFPVDTANIPALLALLMAAAIIPDIDLFPLLWGDMAAANSNHQQFSHSLLFTAAVALLITLAASLLGCGRFLRLSPYFIAAAWSHLLLDMLTHDSHEPIGIMLFWPFSDTRFNSPVSLFGGLAKSRLEDLISWHNLQQPCLPLRRAG